MQFLADVLDYAVDAELSGVLGHVGVGGDLDEVHFCYGDLTSRTDCTVWSQTTSELLVVEDSSSEWETLHEIFLDEENRRSGLLVAFLLVCNSLGRVGCTLRRTSGGVKVKIPSLGMLTPRPILKLRLMYNPRAFQTTLISSSFSAPYTL